jgi:hypothetical protein
MRPVLNIPNKLTASNTENGDSGASFIKREDLWAVVRANCVGLVAKQHELLSLLISFAEHWRFEAEFL